MHFIWGKYPESSIVQQQQQRRGSSSAVAAARQFLIATRKFHRGLIHSATSVPPVHFCPSSVNSSSKSLVLRSSTYFSHTPQGGGEVRTGWRKEVKEKENWGGVVNKIFFQEATRHSAGIHVMNLNQIGKKTQWLASNKMFSSDPAINTTTTRRRSEKRKSEQEFTTPTSKIIRRCHSEEDQLNSNFGKLLHPDAPRKSPLPTVTFADGTELWDLMCKMDIKYKKNPDPFKNHPVLGPQMRAILIDWIMDVCEAYNLLRETLYLAIDYLDRYITAERDIIKQQLQLIGISCLFVASKVEEIYPPKLSTFAYVTDGACTETEILDMEIVIMKTLKWKLTPVTPCNWLNIYLQVLSTSGHSAGTNGIRTSPRRNILLHRDFKKTDSLVTRPLYSGYDFVRAIRILDLCSLDLRSLGFTYSTMAAAAIYNTKGKEAALECSGFSWEALAPCAYWMAPFAQVIKREKAPDVLPTIQGVPEEARHLIQSQCISLALLEKVQVIASSIKVCSPIQSTDVFLTPPRSAEKSRKSRRCF